MGKSGNNILRRIGLLGGMFNPVHHGHLRIAIECKQTLQLDELRMLPCAEPPHREKPVISPQQRLDMLQVTLAHVDGVTADGRELARSGLSYTIDTLRSIKSECPEASLILIMGSDTFQHLDTWREWQKILTLANIVIAQRPDYTQDALSPIGVFLANRFVTNSKIFSEHEFGKIFALSVSQLAISSSHIRDLLGKGMSAQFLLPEVTLNFINNNNLYSKSAVQSLSSL